MHYLKIEKIVRDSYNETYKAKTEKQRLEVGLESTKHEYDIYEKNKIIAGVSTSPWKNKSGTNNTGGQDRASTELLWLSLWNGNEKRWHILTDKEMSEKLFKKFKGTPFRQKVSIYNFNIKNNKFTLIGTIG